MTKAQKFQLLLVILLNYFTFAIVTNITGVLLPFWKQDFNISSDAVVTFLVSFFFIAYALTSLPQGVLLEKIGNKKTLLWGASLILVGAAIFSLMPIYSFGLASLFIMGVGVTAMQIVGNLLVKELDEDPNNYSRNLTMAQVAAGLGGAGGGVLIKYLVEGLNWEWVSAYYVFGGLALSLCILAIVTKIPELKTEDIEKKEAPNAQEYLKFATNPLMLIFALGIFTYVGIEVGVASFISRFLGEKYEITQVNAGLVVSLFWTLQAVGRFAGGLILNYIPAPKALIIYSVGCLSSIVAAVVAPSANASMIAFISAGFFTSIMFPCIFSLAVNSFDKKHEGTVAGVLCTAIVGGAVTAPVIGLISDISGSLGTGLIIAASVSFAYIAFVGVQAINNESSKKNDSIKTVNNKKQEVLI
ncbi:MAG: MFS transporter [Candidatus Caenarcaniphilales bacterium]|nr:MFS transporter [Candidatus Caenarcaniphilales bacterium]